jgi:hypothetical protein
MVNIIQVKQLAITKRPEGLRLTPAEKPAMDVWRPDKNYLPGCHRE